MTISATKITTAQKRQLSIVLSDYINNRPPSVSDEEYFATIGKLTAMAAGTVPYEPIIREFHTVKPAESNEKTYIAYFVASAADMRTVKLCLQTSFDLVHLPQAKEVKGEDGYKRFRVMNVTKASAQQVFAENKELFTRLTFNDEDRQTSGQKAETTLPKTPAQLSQEVIHEEVKIPEAIAEDPINREDIDAAFEDEEDEKVEDNEVLEAPEIVEFSDDEEVEETEEIIEETTEE
jgi:hypothetical protein